MASFTTPTSYATGTPLAVTDFDAVGQNTLFLYQKPYIGAFNSVTCDLADATWSQVTLGGLTASNYGFSVSSNNIVVPLTGVYSVSFTIQAAGTGGATAQLQAAAYHNGTIAISGSVCLMNSAYFASSGSGIIACSSGDTIGLWGNQDNGTGLDTQTGPAITFLSVFFLGSQ